MHTEEQLRQIAKEAASDYLIQQLLFLSTILVPDESIDQLFADMKANAARKTIPGLDPVQSDMMSDMFASEFARHIDAAAQIRRSSRANKAE